MNSPAQSRYLAIFLRGNSRNALHEVRVRESRRHEVLRSVHRAAGADLSQVRVRQSAGIQVLWPMHRATSKGRRDCKTQIDLREACRSSPCSGGANRRIRTRRGAKDRHGAVR